MSSDSPASSRIPDPSEASTTHPLADSWKFWYRHTQGKQSRDCWGNDLFELGAIESVEAFWQYFQHICSPTQVDVNVDLYFFRSSVKPEWEDPANVGGGRWTALVHKDRKNLDFYWENIILSLIGESFTHSDRIVGLAFVRRKHSERLSLWLKKVDNSDDLETIAKEARDSAIEGCSSSKGFNFDWSPHPTM